MIKNRMTYVFLSCLLASVFLLSGCGENSSKRELQNTIDQLRLDAAHTIVAKKITEWQLPKAVKYTANGAESDNANVVINTKDPLQAYPVNQLKFVGTLTQNNQVSAYILAPDSMIYLAKSGDFIGNNYGKIIKIDSEHIEVSEKVLTGNQTTEHIVTMELKD